jgi:Putative transmembrane protein (PGPGW)
MGLIGWISDQRENLIVDNARTYLDHDEDVVDWVRAREPNGKGEGFVFATAKRVVVHWTGDSEGNDDFLWREIHCWGINTEVPGGPVLSLEGEDSSALVQMPVETHGATERVARFLARFRGLAPTPRRAPATAERLLPGVWSSSPDIELPVERKSVPQMTKRIAITALGLALVLVGIVLLVAPGPGILVVIAGLAVLASEYDWAKDALMWARERYRRTRSRFEKPSPTADE